jgi:hypothetical protein
VTLPVELADAVESDRPARNSVPEGRLSAMFSCVCGWMVSGDR